MIVIESDLTETQVHARVKNLENCIHGWRKVLYDSEKMSDVIDVDIEFNKKKERQIEEWTQELSLLKDKYVFAYIPEGYANNEEGESTKILNEYLKRVHKDFPEIKMNSYTSEDQDLSGILRGFEDGKIEMIYHISMAQLLMALFIEIRSHIT